MGVAWIWKVKRAQEIYIAVSDGDYLENTNVDEKIILKCILEK
jgi:hypothetical protein